MNLLDANQEAIDDLTQAYAGCHQGRVAPFVWSTTDTMKTWTEQLSYNRETNPIYAVGITDADGNFPNGEALQTCVTGNGPLSEAHARLYAGLHNSMPWLIKLLHVNNDLLALLMQVESALDLQGDSQYQVASIKNSIDRFFTKHGA